MNDLTAQIKHQAMALGFDAVGITQANPVDASHRDHFEQWLQHGYAGSMQYMHNHQPKRMNPALLHENTQSIVVVALNYKPAQDLQDTLAPGQARVAHYAWYPDYHTFIKTRLHQLLDWVTQQVDFPGKAKICVDSAPVAERTLAHQAGLGFIGKNHMLIHPALGPELFLGELFLPLSLEPDRPVIKDCALCRLCLDACPTGALQEDGFLNASRCLNTLTIEHKCDIPQDLSRALGDRIYGCDQCVRACPYTHKAPAQTNPDYKINESHQTLDIQVILNMDQDTFDQTFSDSPIHRLGLDRLKRNAECLLNQEPQNEA